jgi:hypothetical protein
LEPEGGHLAGPRLRGGCGGGPAAGEVSDMAPPPRRSLPELGGLWAGFWGDGEAFGG